MPRSTKPARGSSNDARVFEYLLGRFTEPSELFGPIDLRRLREGVVEADVTGMLPEAEIAFLDEVFLGSTAILNTLLALLNERTYRRGHTHLRVPLRVCVAASNALPEDDSLAAFADRFLLRLFVAPVPDASLEALLEAGDRLATHVAPAPRRHARGSRRAHRSSARGRARPRAHVARARDSAAAQGGRRALRSSRGQDGELWRRGRRLASTLEAHVDGALRADRHPALRPTNRVPDPIALTFDASDVGALPVHDLALLPSGKLVVALGEAGVRVYARDGRHVATIDAPADALVVSDHGSYVIAVARRGELHRLTRIDLDRRIARPWWEARLTSFARTFDGTRWLVSESGVATSIDATDDRWSALARLPDIETERVDRAGDRALLIASDDIGSTFDRWTYDVGPRRLHRREEHDLDHQFARLGGRTAEVVITQSDDVVSITRLRDSWKRDLPRLPLVDAVRVDDSLAVVPSRRERGVEVEVIQKALPAELALIELQGTQRCAIALAAPLLAIGDDLGRVLVLDVLRARVRLDLRVRA